MYPKPCPTKSNYIAFMPLCMPPFCRQILPLFRCFRGMPCIMARPPCPPPCTHTSSALAPPTLGWLKINGCLAKSAWFLEEPLKGPSSCFVKIVSSGRNGTTPAPQNKPDACHACVSSRKVRNKRTRKDYPRDSVEICRVRSGNSFTIPRLVILWALSGSSSRSMSALHLGGTSAPSRRDSRESDRV